MSTIAPDASGSVDPVEGSGATPGSTSGSPDSGESLADAIADIDASLLGEAPPSKKGEGKDTSASADDPIQAIIDKRYGGDRAAFAASVYERDNAAADMARQMAEMRVKLDQITSEPAARADREEVLKEAVSSSQVVQALDQEVQSIDADIKIIPTFQQQIMQRAGTIQGDIRKIEGQLLKADDVDKPDLRADLNDLKSELRALDVQFTTNEREAKSLSIAKARLLRERASAVDSVRRSMEEQERSTRDQAVYNRTQLTTYSAAFDQIAAAHNIQGDQATILKDLVRSKLSDWLISLGESAEEVDIPEATQKVFDAYARAFGVRPAGPRRASVSPAAPARRAPITAARVAPSDGSYRAPALDDVLSDPKLVRKRAAAVFGALARSGKL